MKTLVILNDPPYGTERSHNGLRLAESIAGKDGEEDRVFLMGDAASCAEAGQKVPAGDYNIATIPGSIARRGGGAGGCGTCIDARGITESELSEGTHRSTTDERTASTLEVDPPLIF